MNRPNKILFVGPVLVLLLLYASLNFSLTCRWLIASSEPGWVAAQEGQNTVVRGVSENGPATGGLIDGDVVIRINETVINSSFMVFDLFQHSKPNSRYRIYVKRNGDPFSVFLQTVEHPFRWGVIVGVVVVPLVSLLVAAWILLGGPNNKPSLLIALALGTTIPGVPLFPLFGAPSWILLTMILGRIITSLFFPLCLHFFLLFPKTPRLIDRFPKLQILPYVVFIPVVYVMGKLTWLSAFAPEKAYHYYTSQPNRSRYLICGLYLLGSIAALMISYSRSSDLLRRRIRVLVAGGVIGILPLMISFVYISSSSQLTTWTVIYQWQTFVSFCGLLVIPLSLAYAIRTHNILPIKLIVRHGLRYLFVYESTVAVEIVLVSAVVYFILHHIFRYLRWYMPIEASIWIGLTSFIVVRLTEKFHAKVISPAIKRRFFRQSYQAEKILYALPERLRTVVDPTDVVGLVAKEIYDAFHVQNITVLIRDEKTGRYTSASYYEHTKIGLIGNVYEFDMFLGKDGPPSGKPQEFKDLILMTGGTMNEEQRREVLKVTREVGSDLMIPIATKDRLLGMLSLGPRLGDLPFSSGDKKVLSTIAWEMAMSIENARLFKRTTEEAVLIGELNTAREIQRRLLPQSLPETAIIEFSADSLPAHTVAGDYYDIFIDGGVYDLLVVDVVGKGAPAALLAAFIKATIQSYVLVSKRSLIEIVTSLNKRLFDDTEDNIYATMFYAQLDEANHTLRYVSAGHCKPFIVRDVGSGVELESLDCEGWAVGMFEQTSWEQKETKLFSGDALIVYSDGITDARNSDGLEFGEENLREILALCAKLSAREIVDKIVEAVSGWAGTAAQHDDITVFVVKVK